MPQRVEGFWALRVRAFCDYTKNIDTRKGDYVNTPLRFTAMGPAKAVAVPSGDIWDFCPVRAEAPRFVEGLSVGTLIDTLKGAKASPYDAEAWVHAFRKGASPWELAQLDAAQVGIHPAHPLWPLRELMRNNVASTRSVTPEVALWIWGASAPAGKTLYAEAGTLLRTHWFEPHVVSRPDLYGENDAADLVMAWARASGVTRENVLVALWRTVEDHFLNRRPTDVFIRLDLSAFELARKTTGGDAKLGVLFFRCLQRVAAWSFRGRIRWRSAWLRGPGASGEDAIPGASGESGRLTALLNEHVLERVQGHSAGKKAATYRLKVVLRRGTHDIADVARWLHVEVREDGAPLRSA